MSQMSHLNYAHFQSFLVASPCAAQPCQNGGTCHEYYNTQTGSASISNVVSGAVPLYHCTCVEGFTGKNCEGNG